MATRAYRSLAGVMVLLLCWRPALAEGPSKAKIKAGKAATVLVQGKLRGAQGSAFCIHPSGIFLTNAHVVRDENAVSLVINSGTATAKVVPAKILRTDPQADLALLQAEGLKDMAVLPLASVDKLSETDEVIAFGFPFGQLLASDPKAYPAISVNVGKVTSLREKNGELHRIQLDVVLNPGNSGGPVLDLDGRVVGVVVSRLVSAGGTGVNFAIPVSHVARFVARPEIFFEPPALKLTNVHEAVEFQARTLELVPSTKDLELELILQTERQPQRRFKMELKDGSYRARAVPVPAASGPAILGLTAVYPHGSVKGEVPDQVIKVGGTAVRLSEVRRLVSGPRPRLWLHDGKLLRGELTGIAAAPVDLGTASVTLDLAKAREVRFYPPAGLDSLASIVVARKEGREVGRVTRLLAVQGIRQAGAEQVFLDLDVAPLEKDVVVRQLKAPIRDVAVGGGGRYLILHLPSLNQLAIFDVNEAKVVKTLPVRDANILFTAGLDKLVVALPGSRTIQRWSLTTFEQELAVPYPIKGDILAFTMGSASQGPILVLATEGTAPFPASFQLPLDKLQARGFIWVRKGHHHPVTTQAGVHVRSSLTGTYTGMWCNGYGANWIRWENQIARSTYTHGAHGHVIPGSDGHVLYTGQGMFTAIGLMPNDNKPYPGTDPNGRYLPASDPAYYLYLGAAPTFNNRNSASICAIHKLGVDGPILRLSGIEVPNTNQQQIKDDFTFDKRFHLLPQAQVLIVIPPSNDRLVLHRVDVVAALKKMASDKK